MFHSSTEEVETRTNLLPPTCSLNPSASQSRHWPSLALDAVTSLLSPCTAAAMRLHVGTSIRPSSRQTVASAPTKVTYFYYSPCPSPWSMEPQFAGKLCAPAVVLVRSCAAAVPDVYCCRATGPSGELSLKIYKLILSLAKQSSSREGSPPSRTQ